jgi:hypothetical protein
VSRRVVRVCEEGVEGKGRVRIPSACVASRSDKDAGGSYGWVCVPDELWLGYGCNDGGSCDRRCVPECVKRCVAIGTGEVPNRMVWFETIQPNVRLARFKWPGRVQEARRSPCKTR